MKKRVFISFKSEDKNRISGLRLLNANPDYDLEFYDESLREPVNSTNAVYIKNRIREKIQRSSVTLCLISESTHESEWIDWELQESVDQRNGIIAMALKDVERAVLPRLVKDLGLTFYAWNPQGLKALIENCQPILGRKSLLG